MYSLTAGECTGNWYLNSVLTCLTDVFAGEGDAQAATALPQCHHNIFHRQPRGTRGHSQTVQHQAQVSELRAAVMVGTVKVSPRAGSTDDTRQAGGHDVACLCEPLELWRGPRLRHGLVQEGAHCANGLWAYNLNLVKLYQWLRARLR